jgi:7-cyano-7-deazaguanine synthase
VFVNYGQRHIRERVSAQAVADHYGIELVELDLRSFGSSVRSALTRPNEVAVPHGHYTAETMVATVVPNRNATLLSAAAGIASSRGMTVVKTAVHAGDHAVYPDCRPEFIAALDAATRLGCGVGIDAPFVHRSKADIAGIGAHLGVPYRLTWSCYEGGQPDNPDQHCGRCGTCCERAEAFQLAGVPDPTDYADAAFWREAVAAHAALSK